MAGQGTVSIHAHNKPKGFVGIAAATINAAAAGIPVASIPSNTKIAYIQPEGGDVKWRDDGVAPTAVIGMLLQDGAVMEYTGKLSDLQFIKASGTPKININFYE